MAHCLNGKKNNKNQYFPPRDHTFLQETYEEPLALPFTSPSSPIPFNNQSLTSLSLENNNSFLSIHTLTEGLSLDEHSLQLFEDEKDSQDTVKSNTAAHTHISTVTQTRRYRRPRPWDTDKTYKRDNTLKSRMSSINKKNDCERDRETFLRRSLRWSRCIFGPSDMDKTQSHNILTTKIKKDDMNTLWSRLSNKLPFHSNMQDENDNNLSFDTCYECTLHQCGSSKSNTASSLDHIHGNKNQENSYHKLNTSLLGHRGMTVFLTYAMILQFMCMGGYELFLRYQTYRSKKGYHDDLVSKFYPYWLSAPGLISNPAIGPNAATMNIFGIFNPASILLKNEWWRFITSITMNTSLIQLGTNIFILKSLILQSNRNALCTYIVSTLVAGVTSIIISCCKLNVWIFHTDGIIHTTGLSSGGMMGLISNLITEMILVDINWDTADQVGKITKISDFFSVKYRTLFIALMLDLVSCAFLPYNSIASVVGGAVAGIGCAIFTWIRRSIHVKECCMNRSLPDLESRFESTLHTPPLEKNDRNERVVTLNIVPSPPSQSSINDTPIMRRSILTSPEEEEEEIIRDLNENYDCNIFTSNFQLRPDASSPITTPSKLFFRKSPSQDHKEVFFWISFSILATIISISIFIFIETIEAPSKQAMYDSIYGCRTMNHLISPSEREDINSYYDDKQDSAVWCEESCIPLSLIDDVREMDLGSCFSSGYCYSGDSSIMDINDSYMIYTEMYKTC